MPLRNQKMKIIREAAGKKDDGEKKRGGGEMDVKGGDGRQGGRAPHYHNAPIFRIQYRFNCRRIVSAGFDSPSAVDIDSSIFLTRLTSMSTCRYSSSS